MITTTTTTTTSTTPTMKRPGGGAETNFEFDFDENSMGEVLSDLNRSEWESCQLWVQAVEIRPPAPLAQVLGGGSKIECENSSAPKWWLY